MDQFKALLAQLALDLELDRLSRRKRLTPFPKRPDFVWEEDRGPVAKAEARQADRMAVEGWKAEVMAWKAANGLAELPEAVATAFRDA